MIKMINKESGQDASAPQEKAKAGLVGKVSVKLPCTDESVAKKFVRFVEGCL